MALFHSIRAGVLALALAAPATAAAQQVPPPQPARPAESSFTIFIRAVPAGSEQIAMARTADGWTITGSGRLGAPLDLDTRRLEVRYDPDWKPLELTVEATSRGQKTSLRTTVTGTTARNEITNANVATQTTDTIDPEAVLLPNQFFAPYEALAARLRTAAEGTTISVYRAPVASFTVKVGESSLEQIQTIARVIDARRTRITLLAPGAPPLDAQIWGDEAGRLLRVSVPAQDLEVARDDIASVSARRVTVSRPGDEQVTIPANGFSLAGTISRPAGAIVKPLPTVVLVSGWGPNDRDEIVAGIPIFGQLAGAVADAGFIVLRYDKRGVGQSGGRGESATLADLADDLRAAVKFMAQRKDVDRKQLAIVGHSEGGSVGMLAAAKEKGIAALVLAAATGVTGAELNMQQVTHTLARSDKPDAEKQATIELQKKIQNAVVTGSGWEGVPPALRGQAETPWFQSFLTFDPAKLIRDIRQPILIVQGLLDTQVAPSNADRLEALAKARKKAPPLEVVRMPGINHLLVSATTGEVDEYDSLKDKRVSPAVAAAIVGWLQKTFGAPR